MLGRPDGDMKKTKHAQVISAHFEHQGHDAEANERINGEKGEEKAREEAETNAGQSVGNGNHRIILHGGATQNSSVATFMIYFSIYRIIYHKPSVIGYPQFRIAPYRI